MKKFVSLIFASCLLVVLLTGCKKEDTHNYVTKFIYRNDTELPVTMTCYQVYNVTSPDKNEYDIFEINPNEEYVLSYNTIDDFRSILWGYIMVAVDNTKVHKECYILYPFEGIGDENNYDIVVNEEYERHYLFVFTDDFFAEIESEK